MFQKKMFFALALLVIAGLITARAALAETDSLRPPDEPNAPIRSYLPVVINGCFTGAIVCEADVETSIDTETPTATETPTGTPPATPTATTI